MLSVETFGFSFGQLLDFRSNDFQASVFEASGDLADHVLGNGVRLDDGESTLNSHGETPETLSEAKN
ncbi:hypothetical protein D3C80_1671060 [compost metagenome]